MSNKNILIVVQGMRWVVEGDNYAGFSGYRERQWNFFDMKEYEDFIEAATGDSHIVIKSIETFTIKPDKVLDVNLQLQAATERKAEKKKLDEKAELLREKEKLEKRLKELA